MTTRQAVRNLLVGATLQEALDMLIESIGTERAEYIKEFILDYHSDWQDSTNMNIFTGQGDYMNYSVSIFYDHGTTHTNCDDYNEAVDIAESVVEFGYAIHAAVYDRYGCVVHIAGTP